MEAAEKNKGDLLDRIPSFSVVLIMVVLMIAGLAVVPLLSIQYAPSVKERSMTVSYRWNGASARVVEQEVTSRLEGMLASVSGIKNIRSVSKKDRGNISLTFKKNVNIDAVRFEIASLIRQVYPKLPEGVSYPAISLSTAGEKSRPVITYTLNADLPTQRIKEYAENTILKGLSRIPGVSGVVLSGADPFYYEIRYDPDRLHHYGITVDELSERIVSALGRDDVLGRMPSEEGENAGMTVVLSSGGDGEEFGGIAVKNAEGRIVRLRDVADIRYREELPSSYLRINGLNTINVTVYADKYVNTIRLADLVKAEMKHLEATFPPSYSAIVADDSSVYLKAELEKIVFRTVLSVLILLLFVYAVSRSLRYLGIIALTLAANISIAFIFYYLFRLEIHLYSLAGITVSLGIIIDTSIIMIDHYGYYRNRKAFLAILAALLTTIGSLSVVFFLPERQQANLADFSAVVIVNLAVSLLVALMFVPALMEQCPIASRKRKRHRFRRKRRAVRFGRFYERFIRFGRRWRWALIVAAVLGFGLPLHLLPKEIKGKKEEPVSFWARAYNETFGSSFYQERLREPLEKCLGGSFRLFSESVGNNGYYREPERTTLYINAGMPEGCTVQQLNDIMVVMDNYLSQFEEIEMFRTRITAYDQGSIEVTFKPKYENGSFPLYLKNAVIGKANVYGGADWGVHGIDMNGFSNKLYSGYKSNRITLTGYNYDRLYEYAEELVRSLKKNPRVSEPGIYGEVGWNATVSRNEYFIDYNRENIALYDFSLADCYVSLSRQLYSQTLRQVVREGALTDVALVSADREGFDVWHLKNRYIPAGDRAVRFSSFGTIEKRRTGNDIYKENQEYALTVAYDFIGPYELANKVTKAEAEQLDERLPLGYKAEAGTMGWRDEDGGTQFWLIVLIIVIIYFICSVLFESLLQPLVIISLIPISFIGVFLTFYLTGFRFDQGGFASFVLLAGIVVNAGIYMVNQYNLMRAGGQREGVRLYLKAYHHKTVPIRLTVLSTILGLIPFLYDGQSEVFWFSFAVGTMGGLTFSLLALWIYMPVFMPLRPKRRGGTE